MAGRIEISVALVEKRRERASALKMKGLSINSIMNLVNQEATIEQWGVVSRRTIMRDIAAYFSKNKLTGVEANEEMSMLRDAYISQYEGLIEKMHIKLSTKQNWKPFEEFAAMDILRRTLADFAEIMNWNEGRKNTNILFQQNNILTPYENAANIVNKPKELKAISALCDMMLDKRPIDEIGVEVLGDSYIKEDTNDNNT